MTATPKPTLTFVYSTDDSDLTNIHATGRAFVMIEAAGADVVYLDVEYSATTVDAVTKVAEALGAEVVELNERFRPDGSTRKVLP